MPPPSDERHETEYAMSALRSVQLAIELATRNRDDLAKVVARIERSLAFGHGQLTQLEGYAAETDGRWIGSAARSVSTELMHHHYQFMDRLQQAIHMQSGAIASTARQLEQAKANLLHAEFRLAGLNQVLKSRQAALMCRERLREQRQTDEFAAQQYTRNRMKSMSGECYDH